MVSARSFLVPFRFSHKEAFVVEFSHQKIRIYEQKNAEDFSDATASVSGNSYQVTTAAQDYFVEQGIIGAADDVDNHWNLSDDGNDEIISVASPYKYVDLWDNEEMCFKLQTIQHGNVLYIFSEAYPIKMLKRYANASWALEELELLSGPFCAMNSTQTAMTASALTGTITLTSDGDVFSSNDVGRLVRLRGYDGNEKVWTSGVSVTNGDVFMSDNKFYVALNSGTSGSKKPVHTEGIRSDGGVRWAYLHDGSGVVKITAYTNARSVTATVLKRLPEAACDGTVYWELGVLNKGENYPKSGAFFRNRFAFLINTKTGPLVCLSKSGDYNNFADIEFGETTAESAITVPVINTEFNEGKWLFAGDVLFVGTGASEFYIDAVSSSSPMANDNIKICEISRVGSKAIMPVKVGAHVLFVDRYGLSLRDLSYNYYSDGYDEMDISILGKHLFSSRIVAIAYQETPDKILWCLTGDGTLAAMTFSAEQEVVALSRHDFSGMVESIAVIPNLTAGHDELWLEIKRVIKDKTLRTVEFLEEGMPVLMPVSVYRADDLSLREKTESKYVQKHARYLDGAVLFVRGRNDSRTSLSGLSHLEGEKVKIFADGEVCADQLVINGSVEIKATDNMVLVGKEIISQYVPQAIYLNDENGSGIGNSQRINHVVLMLYLSGGGEIGEDYGKLSPIYYRPTDKEMDTPQELFSGVKEILFNGSTDMEGSASKILIENTSPLPMNILAIVPCMD